jgi:hypothetical protein
MTLTVSFSVLTLALLSGFEFSALSGCQCKRGSIQFTDLQPYSLDGYPIEAKELLWGQQKRPILVIHPSCLKCRFLCRRLAKASPKSLVVTLSWAPPGDLRNLQTKFPSVFSIHRVSKTEIEGLGICRIPALILVEEKGGVAHVEENLTRILSILESVHG